MKISLTRIVAAAVALGVVLALSGCKDDGPSSKVFVKIGTGNGPRIAVLPFDTVGNVRSQDAGRVLTSTVITYLLSTGSFQVIDPGALEEAIVTNQIRITEGLKKADLEALQKALNIDGVILGLVEEYGDVRVGNDSYPCISFSARLVNARNGGIVWAGTISKTGADKVKVFDIGRISSMGKLSKSAVQEMAMSLARTSDKLVIALAPPEPAPSAPQAPTVTQAEAPAQPTTSTPTVEPAVATTPPAVTPAVATAGKSTDESKTYGEAELKALLPDIAGYNKGEFDYKKHYHDTIEGRYNSRDGTHFIDIKLVDYRKVATSERFVQMYHAGEEAGKLAGMPAFIKVDTEFSYQIVDLPIGRFGVFIKGPSAKKNDVERVASEFANAVK
ncbi:MAG: DUF799 family lipoprotein [Armatimonadetes bacterium]|nr:DUF799 family lipoprotein [Armatimonadota bacterium]